MPQAQGMVGGRVSGIRGWNGNGPVVPQSALFVLHAALPRVLTSAMQWPSISAIRPFPFAREVSQVSKKRGTFTGLFQIYRFAKPYWWVIGLTLLSMGLFTTAELGFLYLIRPFIDAFSKLLSKEPGAAAVGTHFRLEELMKPGYQAMCLAPVLAVLAFCKEWFSARVQWGLLTDIRNALCTALLPQSLKFFEDRRSGDLLSRITNDVNRTQVAFQQIFEGIPQRVFHVIMGTAAALYFGRELLLGGVVIVPFVLLPVIYLARRIRRYGREGLQKLSELTEQMTQMFTGIRVIKAFKMEDAETEEFRRVNRKFLGKMLKIAKMRGLSAGILELLLRGFIGGAIALAALFWSKGYLKISPGNLLVCIGGVYYAFNALRRLTKSYNRLQETVPAADRIIDMIQHRPSLQDAPDARPLDRIRESIVFRNVSFAYDEEPVLKNVSVEVKPGEQVALIGKSGAGKSTFAALAMRFYDVTEGSVEFDGVDVRKVTRESLLDRIAIVSQQTFLFNRTIAENIRYGRRDATMEEVERAAKLANIHDFIVSLPDGYETMCGELGAKLSGGQRQRVAIARALLKDADILILDEAMVGLDTESEGLVREALRNLMKGRTTFIITHDVATIRNADRILVLRDGRLVAQGRHEELIRDCEEYRVLYGMVA